MDEDYFWQKLEGIYGNINPHLKKILSMCNLCSQSLSRLTREAIMLVERDLREMAEDAMAKALAGGPSLESVYGRFACRPHEFKFLEGEILCLLDLANIIQTHGIKTFIKPVRKIGQQGRVGSALVAVGQSSSRERHESTAGELDRLRFKISAHFSKPKYRYFNHEDFMSNLIITECYNSGQRRVEITCPLCPLVGHSTKLSATADITGNWNVYSFTRHVGKKHPSGWDSVASMLTKRRSSDDVRPEASSPASSPPRKLPLMEKRNIENNAENENGFILNDLPSSSVSSHPVIHLKIESANATEPDEDQDFMEFSVEYLEDSPEGVSMDSPERNYIDDIIEYSPEDIPEDSFYDRFADIDPQLNDTKVSITNITDIPEDTRDDSSYDSLKDNDLLLNDTKVSITAIPEDTREDSSYDSLQGNDPLLNDTKDIPEDTREDSCYDSLQDNDPLLSETKDLGASIARRPLLDIGNSINSRSLVYNKRGIRYSQTELDAAAYDLLTGGNTSYHFREANMSLPSAQTVKRHISKNTTETQEGQVMVQSLLSYLNANQYPLIVALSEDGTAVSPNVQYDQRSNSLRGLVSPLDSNGMPMKDFFKVTSFHKMADDLQSYHTGEYIYVVMAFPMAVGASPICLMYMCTDNRFTYADVLSRWKFMEAELKKAGISVVSISSDGDPRLMKAMKEYTGIPSSFSSKVFGPLFYAELTFGFVCIQDPVHLINKLRLALLDPKRHMRLGQFVVSVAVINEMIQQGCKGVHKLNPSDLNANDKMKFDPSLKLMEKDLINHLRETVAGSKGTVIYLEMMRNIYTAFTDEDMAPVDRVVSVWTSLLLLRAWRWLSFRQSQSFQQCPTTNAYVSLELNAHGLVKHMVNMRDTPEHFIVNHLSSQPCESAFRELRSMTSVNHTAVNFTVKEVEARMRQVNMKLLITHRNKSELTFPTQRKQDAKAAKARPTDLPTDRQILSAIRRAEENARGLLLSVGCCEDDIDFSESINGKQKNVRFEFVELSSLTDPVDPVDPENTEDTLEHEHTAADTRTAMLTTFENVDDAFSKEEAAELLRHHVPDGTPHTFRLQLNGALLNIKKSYVMWLLSSGRLKRSSDRLQRFRTLRSNDPTPLARNATLEEVSVGDWVVVGTEKVLCHITNFKYQTGKLRHCPMTTVPLKCPAGVVKRGIWLLGNFYFIESTGMVSLCNSQQNKQDIDNYITHVMAPDRNGYLAQETMSYLNTLSF